MRFFFLLLLCCSLACSDRRKDELPEAATAGDTVRVLTQAEWNAVSPVVAQYVAALRASDTLRLRKLSVDEQAASQALREFAGTALIVSAADSGLRPLHGGWDGDTIVADFAVPGRTRPSHCYQPNSSDQIGAHLVTHDGAWRVLRMSRPYC